MATPSVFETHLLIAIPAEGDTDAERRLQIVTFSGEPVGTATIGFSEADEITCEASYAISEAFQDRGIEAELAYGLIQHCFSTEGATIVRCLPTDEISRSAFAEWGMKPCTPPDESGRLEVRSGPFMICQLKRL